MGGRREGALPSRLSRLFPLAYFTFFKIAIRKSQYFSTVSM